MWVVAPDSTEKISTPSVASTSLIAFGSMLPMISMSPEISALTRATLSVIANSSSSSTFGPSRQ